MCPAGTLLPVSVSFPGLRLARLLLGRGIAAPWGLGPWRLIEKSFTSHTPGLRLGLPSPRGMGGCFGVPMPRADSRRTLQ